MSGRILCLFSLAVVLTGCGGSKSQDKKTSESQTAAPKNPLEVRPSPELLKQLKVGQPQYREMSGSLRVAGRVQADERRFARVGSPVTGRITDILVYEGHRVRKGEVLARIYSTQLSDAQFLFLKDQSQRDLAQRAAERAKQLLDANVIGNAELQRRQAELEQANAELLSARAQLQILGMNDSAIQELRTNRKLTSDFSVLASIDGTVLERKITVGQIVQPAEAAFTIADLSTVWLVAEVPEQSAGNLRLGKPVQAELSAYPGEIVTGRLSFVSSIVQPETGTVTARMDVPNPAGKFKPAMLATMLLQDRAQRRLVIPATAVVRENNQDNVFVQQDHGAFVLSKVELGDEIDNLRIVTDGLEADDKVVVDGAFHLNNERKRLMVEGGS